MQSRRQKMEKFKNVTEWPQRSVFIQEKIDRAREEGFKKGLKMTRIENIKKLISMTKMNNIAEDVAFTFIKQEYPDIKDADLKKWFAETK